MMETQPMTTNGNLHILLFDEHKVWAEDRRFSLLNSSYEEKQKIMEPDVIKNLCKQCTSYCRRHKATNKGAVCRTNGCNTPQMLCKIQEPNPSNIKQMLCLKEKANRTVPVHLQETVDNILALHIMDDKEVDTDGYCNRSIMFLGV